MNRTNWFNDLKTKAEMNSCAIGIIGVIVGEIHTTANCKVIEIASTLKDLEEAWNTRKPSAPTESPQENSHLDCTMDLEKVESFVNFPIIPLGPLCEVCDCFKCKLLHRCTFKGPTTLVNCVYQCNGIIARNVCQYARKRGFVE